MMPLHLLHHTHTTQHMLPACTGLPPPQNLLAKVLTNQTDEELLADKAALAELLSYHVVPEEALEAAQLTNGRNLTTLLEEEFLEVGGVGGGGSRLVEQGGGRGREGADQTGAAGSLQQLAAAPPPGSITPRLRPAPPARCSSPPTPRAWPPAPARRCGWWPPTSRRARPSCTSPRG